jgi:hypothetical protein
MREKVLVVIALLSVAIAGCTTGTAYPGVLQNFASACDKVNEGQQIAVEGYLRLPDTVTSTSSVRLRLYPDLSFHGSAIGVLMRFGEGPDEARRIVTAYRDEDLKVHLADGTVVPFRTKVRVSGRMRIPLGPSRVMCELDNPYVEKAK